MIKGVTRFLDNVQAVVENYSFPEKSISAFRKLVYVLLAVKMLLVWPELDVFYHYMSLNEVIPRSIRLMYEAPVKNYYHSFWLIMCAVVCYGVISKQRWWLSIIIFVISLVYYKMLTHGTNNGDTLLHFYVFMLVFIHEGAVKGSERQMLNNVVLFALQLSFCILYFINGVGKLVLPFWRDGSFLIEVWQYAYFAQRNLIPDWFTYKWIPVIMSWSIMSFEVSFGILVWFRPFKKWLFSIGLLFHLGIIFLLSIPDFGMSMIIGYLLFTNADILKEINVYRSQSYLN